MKWIGQHIVDLTARFKSGLYLESVSNPGSDTDKFLVIDTNGKVGHRTGSEVLSDIGGGTPLTQEQVEDYAGALVATGGTKTGISVAYQDGTGDMDFAVSPITLESDSGNDEVTPGESLTISGGEGIDTALSSSTLTISGELASTSNKGVASFSSDNFSVSSGVVTIKSGGIDLTDEVTGTLPVGNTAAKVTSIIAGDGIDVSGATGDVTVTAETASDSNPGVVELATTAESITGTSTTLAVTPAGLKARASQIVNIKGYATLQNNVYDYANAFPTDDEAPFQLDVSYGSGTIGSGTEVNQSKLFRAGGFHVPFACEISSLHIQTTCNNAGDYTVALVEYVPSNAGGDTQDYPRTVYVEETITSENNNNKTDSTTVDTTAFSENTVNAGSHLMIMVKGDGTTASGTLVVSVAVGLSW